MIYPGWKPTGYTPDFSSQPLCIGGITPGPATHVPVTWSLALSVYKMKVLASGSPRSLPDLPWRIGIVRAAKGRLRQSDISSDVNIGKRQR